MTRSIFEKNRIARLMKRFTRTGPLTRKPGPKFRPRVEVFEDRVVPALSTTLFELDGNALNQAAAGDDWDNVLLGNGGASIVNTGLITDPAGLTGFTQGTKDILDLDEWTGADHGSPDKDEITNAYAAAYDDAGDLTLYFGADRLAQNGDAAMGFWFFQDEVSFNPATGKFSGLHEVGDIFVIADFSKGGGQQNIFVYEWVGSGGSDGTLDLLASGGSSGGSDNVKAIVNSGQETAPWDYKPKQGGPGKFPAGAFEEGGVNLSALGIEGCFSTFLAETRASTSLSAELKDFVLGQFNLCGIEVTKTGDTLGKITDPVDYTITVENTGAMTLLPVSFTDTLLGNLLNPANPFRVSSTADASLSAGETWTFIMRRTVQAGDPDPLPNTATAIFSHDGTPTGDTVTDSDSHSVNLFQPGIDITKLANKTLLTVGDQVTYSYTVRNTGSADSPAFEQVVVTDDNGTPGNTADDVTLTKTGGDTNGNNKLDLGETWTYSFTRTVVAGDTDPLVNIARVRGVVTAVPSAGFAGGNVLTDQASFTIQLYQPKFKVVKTGDTLGKATDPADYQIVVTNLSSNDTPNLTNPVLTDSLLGNLLSATNPFRVSSNADAALSPGEVWTLTFRRTVLATDPDPLPNTVTASFQVTNGHGDTHTLTPDPATSDLSHSVNLIQPNFTITKTAVNAPAFVDVGSTVNFLIVITDTSVPDPDNPGMHLFDPDGAGPLTALDDTKMGALNPNSFTESINNNNQLDPGEVWTGTFPYVVQASDVPSFTNTVTARFQINQVPAKGFTGTNTFVRSDSETLAVGVPVVTITKTRGAGVPETIHEGDDAVFTITVSNTGTGKATGVVMTDTLTDAGVKLDWVIVSATDLTKVTLANPPAGGGPQLLTATIGDLLAGTAFTVVVKAPTTGIFDVPFGPGDDPNGGLDGLAGTFEFDDNNAVDNANAIPDDWADVFHGTDTAHATTGIIQDNVGGDKTFFTSGGSKDVRDVSEWKSTTNDVAPDKNDIQQAYASVYNLNTDGNPATPETQYLTFGATKFDASGANQIGFWFFKDAISVDPATGAFNGVHQVGDILVLTDFSQGGRVANVKVYKWVGSGGSDGPLDFVTDGSSGNAIAVVNDTTTETSPWPYTDKDGNHAFAPDTFFEGAINTSILGLAGCFNGFLAESRSSGLSLTAQLKDYVLGELNACRAEIPNKAAVDWNQNLFDHDNNPNTPPVDAPPVETAEVKIIVVD